MAELDARRLPTNPAVAQSMSLPAAVSKRATGDFLALDSADCTGLPIGATGPSDLRSALVSYTREVRRASVAGGPARVLAARTSFRVGLRLVRGRAGSVEFDGAPAA